MILLQDVKSSIIYYFVSALDAEIFQDAFIRPQDLISYIGIDDDKIYSGWD